jgi:hypothetical protein
MGSQFWRGFHAASVGRPRRITTGIYFATDSEIE